MSTSTYPTLAGAAPDVERKQIYDTASQSESGGRDLTLSARTQARYFWRINYPYVTEAELATLSAFVHSMKGKADFFYFLDPLMPTATHWHFRDGMGTGTIRTAGNGSWSVAYFCDPNGDPVAATTSQVVTVVSTVLVEGVGYTVSNSDGAQKITFTGAMPDGADVFWSGYYYRRAKFVEDGLTIRRVVSGVYTATVELISQVLP